LGTCLLLLALWAVLISAYRGRQWGTARSETSEGLRKGGGELRPHGQNVARRWWQHKWYFFLPVAVVLGFAFYSAALGHWKVAAIYFGAAAFYALLARRRWDRYGKPAGGER
jgi:hypothetical protein